MDGGGGGGSVAQEKIAASTVHIARFDLPDSVKQAFMPGR